MLFYYRKIMKRPSLIMLMQIITQLLNLNILGIFKFKYTCVPGGLPR